MLYYSLVTMAPPQFLLPSTKPPFLLSPLSINSTLQLPKLSISLSMLRRRTFRRRRNPSAAASSSGDPPPLPSPSKRVGPDISTLLRRFWKVAAPYWSSEEDKVQARLRLASVFVLTLATTGISVGFSFLGRDFYNALANKDQDQFMKQLLYYLGAFARRIPIFLIFYMINPNKTHTKHIQTTHSRSQTSIYFTDSLPFLSKSSPNSSNKPPSNEDVVRALESVRLGDILARFNGLDSIQEWSSVLSLDDTNEAHLYSEIEKA